jgi:4-aminobutyrate aminotransferase / (S)-3-amino-2-methylpropionate transaminase / 5-aminovalerate transaminase
VAAGRKRAGGDRPGKAGRRVNQGREVNEESFGAWRPRVKVAPPGPESRRLAAELARYESPNVTYLADDFPVFWDEAKGANVRDIDGNVYVDLTAAFAVAGAGHAHPRIVRAVQRQAGRLMHGMGDVHPPAVKVELLRALAEVAPGGLTRSVLANSGGEAVEAALKTAAVASGRPRVLAFHGGYHGLTYGALDVSGREDFRAPFSAQLGRNAVFAPYPYTYRSAFGDDPDGERALAYVRYLLDTPGTASEAIGAVLVEPVQGRGGDVVPPPGWLPGLRRICDERGLLLIFDEIYTGFGRTGRWFACQHWDVVPDLMVVGKAMTGGLPFAACIGTDAVMGAWPRSTGEAIHTSTFLGNPLGCAAALASIETLREERLVERSAVVGARLLDRLRAALAEHPHVGEVRGLGLMIGIELVRDRHSREPARELAGRVMVESLRRGVLVLGGGLYGNVLSLSPPFVIADAQLDAAVGVLLEVLDALR